MYGLIQRVNSASVTVKGETIGHIGIGVLALVGLEKTDGEQIVRRMIDRILNYRIFEDDKGRMNLSLHEVNGGLLLVPQFTLAADTAKGQRPSFSNAMVPAQSEELFELAIEYARQQHEIVETGKFGAYMAVKLVNDGPVTFMLHVNE